MSHNEESHDKTMLPRIFRWIYPES